MKTQLESMLAQLRGTSATTRIALAGAVLVLAAVAVVGSWVAGRPHFTMLYSGIDAQRAAAIQAALAQGGVRYEVSQPPGPFVIHVDQAQYYAAQNLVALSGALETAPEGIQTGGNGAAQVFLSAPERAQSALKREWQELEKQLEELDFVLRAHVSTSTPESSPLRRGRPMTVAVTLALRGGATLEKAQAETVAKLVRYRFDVPSENVIVSDQSGRSLWDGASGTGLGGAADDLLEHTTRFDSELVRTTNAVLDRILGPGLACVVVRSHWDAVEEESVREKIDGKPVVVSRTESKSSTPQGSENTEGGVVGGAASLAQDAASDGAARPQAEKATTSETRTESLVGRETEHRRRAAPELVRMSVSLFVDESLADRLAALEASVKASVGFVPERDAFSSMATPFASVPRDEQGKVVVPPAPEVEEAPSRTLEMLIERGVEIACALAFLFVLIRSLKLARGARAAGTAASAGAGAGELDDPRLVEAIAKERLAELAREEPDRVGSILSRWATEEEVLVER